MPSKPTQPDLFSALEPPPPPPNKGVAAAASPTASLPLTGRFAEVAVEGPVRGTFTYRVPEHWPALAVGTRVLVPFGRRSLAGFFLGEFSAGDLARQNFDTAKMKALVRVLGKVDGGGEALLTPNLLQLARWMSLHYACPLGATLTAMLPAGVKSGAAGARVRVVAALKTAAELLAEAVAREKRRPAQAALLKALAAAAETGAPPISAAELLEKSQSSDAALKSLAKAGFLKISEERPDDGLSDDLPATESELHDLALNDEQQAALTPIETALNSGVYAGFLLQGVTGSGKTEVYLRALKSVLAAGKQGIVLVPEIALTPQTARRFQARLGHERVAILHSHVTGGERADAWRAIRNGQIDVVVGARSALFAPLPRLGIIVVDEEHENAFKQESTPRYNARDVAAELARLSSAALILGSATPSLESLHAARSGKLTHLHLNHRVANRPLPPVEVVDLNTENFENKKYTYLSRRLITALDKTLHRREQAILFMNRRGFATVVTCLRCGYTEKCVQCDITLTTHRQEQKGSGVGDRGSGERQGQQGQQGQQGSGARGQGSAEGASRGGASAPLLPADPRPLTPDPFRSSPPPPNPAHHAPENLVCHYCNYTKPVPDTCSGCGSTGVKHWGLGTERVELEVKKAFPSARVARMDSDTMVKRTAYADALAGFRDGKIDILVGTQMIAKGLDFPNVTLVGVVLADTSLHMPDFRSRERTFQLLAQVAGRAGRGEKGGVVIIQTHLPHDPAVRAAAQHDFDSFAHAELKERRDFNYPPYSRMARVLVRGKDLPTTKNAAEHAAALLRANVTSESAQILGPSEATIAKLEGFYRWHILIKAKDSATLATLFGGAAGDALAKLKGADATVDVDPLSMM